MKKRKIIVCACFILLVAVVAAVVAVTGRDGGGDITPASLRQDNVKSMSILVSDPTRYLELSDSETAELTELLSQVQVGTDELPDSIGTPIPRFFKLTLKNGSEYVWSISNQGFSFHPYTESDEPERATIYRIDPTEDPVLQNLLDLADELHEKYMAVNNPNY